MPSSPSPSHSPVKKVLGRQRKAKATDKEEKAPRSTKAARGTKATKIAYAIPDAKDMSIVDNPASDEENVILQLAIKPNSPSDPFTGDGLLQQPALDPPNAYNLICQDTFASIPCEVEPAQNDIEKSQHNSSVGAAYNNSLDSFKVISLLKDFEEKNKNNEWPSSTSIHCYWCCHRFDGAPIGIPVKYVDGRFHVYGCFCSLECAAAYNFGSQDSYDEILERHQLLNLLARKLGHCQRVRSAPDRLSLKMFGGHLDIDSFRLFTKSNKVIGLNFPPMMTITQQIEEFNDCDITSTDCRYIPIDTERVNRYKDKMIVKRNTVKSLNKNTLDSTMKIHAE